LRSTVCWKCSIAAAFLLCGLSCNGGGGSVVVRPIPGTEQVSADQFSISVSPDERWLAFTEWVLPKAQVLKEQQRLRYYFRITTLDLKTGQVAHHAIDSLSPIALGFQLSRDGRERQA
jgi:hypothetical protein